MQIALIIVSVCLVAVAAYNYDFGSRRARAAISAWAESNGYELIDWKRRNVLTGPFFFRPDTKTVYRLTVKKEGQVIRGWILLSFWKQEVLEVDWDKWKEAGSLERME